MLNFSLSEVNLFCLKKQHLTDDSRTDDIVQMVSGIGGLHATSPTTPYLSLFARAMSVAKEDLDEELYVKRNLGKIRCMRRTVYVLTKAMIPIAYSATRRMAEPASERYAEYLGVTKEQYEEAAKTILEILKGRGMTTKEIKKTLQTELNISAIVNLMCDQGLLIRGVPQTGWKSNTHTYYSLREYFPDIDLNGVDEAKARRLLVRQYLVSFGPVTENDAAWWTGFAKGEIRQILESLRGQIAQVEISGMVGRYVTLSLDVSSLELVKLSGKHVVNLLPSLDPYLMGYKERERYIDLEHYDKVFDRSDNATSTILLDGRVIGVWDSAEAPDPLVKLHLFKEVDRSVLSETYSKAQEIGKFMANGEVQIKECDSMVPLTRRPAGAVMSPLKGG
jgi:hypothetical protein